MPAYILAEIEVTDPARYEEYKVLAPPAIARRVATLLPSMFAWAAI